MGDLSIEAGLTDQGIAAYRAAIKIDASPGNVNKLISGYVTAGLLDDAMTEVNVAIKNNPEFYDFLMTRANISTQMGDNESARTDYTTFLEKAPADSIFRQDVQRALDALN